MLRRFRLPSRSARTCITNGGNDKSCCWTSRIKQLDSLTFIHIGRERGSPAAKPSCSFDRGKPQPATCKATGQTWMKHNMEELKDRPIEVPRRFPGGKVVYTPKAKAELPPYDVLEGLCRHITGDWGDVDEEGRVSNEVALEEGNRIFSVYFTIIGQEFWIITEPDRSITTVLLPEDY